MLGKRLTQLRKEKDMSQEELANMLGMSRSTYAQYEVDRREPDYETLVRLAEFFDVSVDYLLGKTNIKEPYKEGHCTLDDEWPEVANILRRKGKKATPADKRRIAKIIEAAIEDTED